MAKDSKPLGSVYYTDIFYGVLGFLALKQIYRDEFPHLSPSHEVWPLSPPSKKWGKAIQKICRISIVNRDQSFLKYDKPCNKKSDIQ